MSTARAKQVTVGLLLQGGGAAEGYHHEVERHLAAAQQGGSQGADEAAAGGGPRSCPTPSPSSRGPEPATGPSHTGTGSRADRSEGALRLCRFVVGILRPGA